MVACFKNYTDIVERLLKEKVNIEARNNVRKYWTEMVIVMMDIKCSNYYKVVLVSSSLWVIATS